MSQQAANRCQAADNCDEEQVVQSMSVSVKKSCFDEHAIHNLDERLKDILKKQVDRGHVVQLKNLANSHHQLKGCFCGIKAVREELQQILKEKMKEKQPVNKQTMFSETNEVKRQNTSDKRAKTTTHFVPMDKDLYTYLTLNCEGELPVLCTSRKQSCETERDFAIQIELNPEEDVEKIKNDIFALQNRFVVREHKVSEDINFSKLKVALKDIQKKSVMTVFDREQIAKVIGPPKEAEETIQWIMALPASQHFGVQNEIVTKHGIETANEKTHSHPDKNVTTTEETKRDEKKKLTDDTSSEHQAENIAVKDETRQEKKPPTDNTKSENPDNKGTTTNDTKGDKKTQNDDTTGKSYPDKNRTSKGDTMGYDVTKSEYPDKNVTTNDEDSSLNSCTELQRCHDKKTQTDDTSSEHRAQNVTRIDETRGDDNKQLIYNAQSENPNKKSKTTDDSEGEDDGTPTDDTNSENQMQNNTTKDEARRHIYKKPLTDNTESENPEEKGTTTEDTQEDKTALTDDTTSEHPNLKGASNLAIMKIHAQGTMLGHDSMRGGKEESNLNLDISKKELADDRDKEINPGKAATKFFTTGNKSKYDSESQGLQTPNAATTGSYPVQKPSKQRKLMHHMSMDEDEYKYIQTFLHEEFEDLKALCSSVQELRDESSEFRLGYTVKYEVNNETARRRFQQLKDQVKVEEYNTPDMISASVLESLVHASAKSERTMTFVQSEKNSLKIVGQPDRVDKLKKRIEETVSEQLSLLSQEKLPEENRHTCDSEQPCKQQTGAKFYHHIPIDKNLFTYISTHCPQEMERASKCCTSISSSQKRSTFTIDFELQDKRDEKVVKQIFEKLMGQFKVEEYMVQKGIDFAGLDFLIQDMNNSKVVMIFPHEDKQLLKLIGPNTQVSKTKKWIESLISNTIQSEQPSKQKSDVTYPNVHSSPITDQPQRSGQSIPFASTSLQKGNPVHSQRKPGERFRITSATSDSLVYESKRVKNQLTVRVHTANIIKQKTDVLVSYEDERLQGCTVLAIAMKEAAGPDVERELANISKNCGHLEVGQTVHTSAGKLRPFVNYLVHAVRAKRSQHHPDDPKTFEILYKTFLNCFKYTNDKIYQKSISIPPIGSDEYGVQLVSAAFFQAFEEYDAIAETMRSLIPLRSIHFIDHNPAVVKKMVESIKSMIE